jgi:HAD superfamily hydrolase (TIGR01662 family)
MGLVSPARCDRIMLEMNRRLDGLLEWIRFCPHHRLGLRPAYRRACACRKPEPGMLQEALTFFEVKPEEALFIGDRDTDRRAAEAAGIAFQWAAGFFAGSGG